MNVSFLGTAENKSLRPRLSRIFRVENHDEALSIWRSSGGAERILVHVDAHHDVWWVCPGRPVNIANFVSPALRDGLLREVYWVVPDGSWESAGNRRQVLHHLRRIQEGFPGRRDSIEIQSDRISTTLLGKPLHICSVEGLPEFREEVLLDLDVDYLILPSVRYGPGDPHPLLPWIWPEDLVSRLGARRVRSDLVTIAYSVHGGYTPLCWKYLGDELQARLNGADPALLRGMESMREAAEAAAKSDWSTAEEKYLVAAEHLPALAAPVWHFAFMYLEEGRTEEARQMYWRAIQMDSSYRTPFNNEALWHYWERRWDAAERECRRTLALDERDAHAHLGLGWLAMERSEWKEAESEFRRAVEARSDLLDAHRGLGTVLQKLGRPREALAACEKSLKLALAGEESLHECPGIGAERPRLNDFHHFEVYLKMGELCLALGEWDRAGQYLRMAAAGGLDGVTVRCWLAALAFRQGCWKTLGLELAQAWKQLVVQLGRSLRARWRSLRRPFLRAYELWRVR